MRTTAIAAVLLAATLGLAACGDDGTTATSAGSAGSTTTAAAARGASPSSGDDVSTITTTLVDGKPHFGSPEDAMRFLAAAWNADDEVNLKHVTDPSARGALDDMHQVATNLRLDHCERNTDRGDYDCYFDHDYPAHASTTMQMDDPMTGHAVFTVGPADTPGWYMTVLESCS